MARTRGEWHLSWKSRAEDSCTEVVIGPHRADIRTREGVVVELQASPIDACEIDVRERFYGNMVWLLDGRQWRREGRFKFARGRFRRCTNCVTIRPDGSTVRTGQCDRCTAGRMVDPVLGDRYRWDHRKKSFDGANKTIYVDTGENIVMIEGALARLGDCRIISYSDFCARLGLRWDPLVDCAEPGPQYQNYVPDRELLRPVTSRVKQLKAPCSENKALPTTMEVEFSARTQLTREHLPEAIGLAVGGLENDLRTIQCDGHTTHARVELAVDADSVGWAIHSSCCNELSRQLVVRLELAKKTIRRIARGLRQSV